MSEENTGMITATVAVSNADESTPNFTAAITDLGKFLEDVRSNLQPATYPFYWDATDEKWYLNGIEHAPAGVTLTVTDESEDMLADGDTVTVTIAANVTYVTDPRKRTADMYDVYSNGTIKYGIPSMLVFVDSADDLEDLPEVYAPGAIAATIGFGSMWQLGSDGEWVAVGAADNSDDT